MTSAADTVEIMGLFDRLDSDTKPLVFEIINSMASNRLTCEEIAIATERMLHGADKYQVLEDLVHLSNVRLADETAQ